MGDPTSRPVTGYPLHPPNGHPPPPQPATAYPYRAPVPNSTFYSQTPYVYPTPHPTFRRRLFASIIIFCFLFFLILFILWLVFRPHYPEYRVTSLSLTNFSVSSQRVSGNWVVHFEAYNPNKKLKLSYEEIGSSIYYKSVLLSETQVQPFDQDTRNLTALEAVFSVLRRYVDNWAANSMSNDIARSGGIEFDFKLVSIVACKTGRFRVRRRILRAICSDIKVVGVNGNGSSGNFTGGPMQCLVF